MASVRELVAGIEVELEAAQKREHKARKEIEVILASAQQEGRSALSEEEDGRCEQLFESIELAKSQQEGIKAKLARAKKIEAEEAEAEIRMREVTRTPAATKRDLPKYDQVMRVGSEERTYHKGNDPAGTLFLRDVARQFLSRDAAASDRLARHMQEERVERGAYVERAGQDIQTGTMGGLVVPQFLVDMTAPAVANLRPFADACNHHALPADGMSVTIPLAGQSSGTPNTTSAALFSESSGSGVSDTALTELDLTLPVKIAAGGQTVSRAAIERGTGIGDVVLQDLFKRYATTLDNELINAASTGLDAVSTANADNTNTTADKVYTDILGAASKADFALRSVAKPNLVVMHGRRWYWFQGSLISTWPLVGRGPGGLGTSIGQDNGQAYGNSTRGYLPNGMLVVVDDNVATNKGASTNQDVIYVTASDECHLFEAPGQPVFIRAEQPLVASLGIQLVVYGYFAYTFKRYPNSVQNVSGTALVGPAGF